MIKVIVITKTKHKIITRFGKKMKKAKKFRALVKELRHPHIAKVCLVNDSKIKYPEPGATKEPGKLWCPYCGKPRQFKSNYRGDDYQWCEVCTISDADFYVKTINRLWGSGRSDDYADRINPEVKEAEVEEKKEKRRERKAKREAKAAAEAKKAERKKRRKAS